MKFLIFLSIFLSIATLIQPSFQQTCVQYNISLLTSPCNNVEPTGWAYLEIGENLMERINSTNLFIDALKQYPYLPNCTDLSDVWNCYNGNPVFSYFKPLKNCATNIFGVPLLPPVIVKSCRSFCDNFVAGCMPYFAYVGLDPVYEKYCTQFSNNDTIIGNTVVKCWDSKAVDNITRDGQTCYPPLTVPYRSNHSVIVVNGTLVIVYDIRDYYANGSNACDNGCPSIEWSNFQLMIASLLPQTLAWISFVLVSGWLIFIMINPEFRTFPSRLVTYLMVSTMPLALAFMLYSFVGGWVHDVWCGDVIAYRNEQLLSEDKRINNVGLCVFQAWLICFSTLSNSKLTAILAYNTDRNISRMKFIKHTPTLSKREVIYLLIGVGLPLILTIIPTAASQMDYEATYIYCFISTADNQAWRIACWFVWMGMSLIVSTFFFGRCLFKLYDNVNNSQPKEVTNIRSHRNEIDWAIRVTICLGVNVIFLVIIIADQILKSTELYNNYVGIETLTICLASGVSEAICRENLYNTTKLLAEFGLGLTAKCIMASMGWIMFLIFGTTMRVRNVFSKNMDNIVISHGINLSRSSSGKGSRNSNSRDKDSKDIDLTTKSIPVESSMGSSV